MVVRFDHVLRPGLCLMVAAMSLGCGLLEADESARVDVFVTHHAAPDPSGQIPPYGEALGKRTWVNDMGWEINLTEGYVVTTGVRLVDCDGVKREIDLAYGPLPEYLLTEDLDVVNMGGGEVPIGEYCSVIVDYGPYHEADAADAPKGKFPLQTDRALEGVTIFLAGIARLGDVTVPFELVNSDARIVDLELREANGVPTPYNVEAGVGALKVTLGKTYDPFFAGVDFNTVDQAALSAELMERLIAQSRAYHGTTIY